MAVALALALAAPATAGIGKRIAKQSARGEFAFVSASESVGKPRSFAVKVRTIPARHFSADAVVTCSRNFQIEQRSASFAGRGRRVKKVGLPMRRPDSCDIFASANLDDFDSGGGKITLTLYAKKR